MMLTPHDECTVHEPCLDRSSSTDCPAEPGRKLRREAMACAWSQLEVRREDGGLRHYLNGQPVHCGDALELQDREDRYDDDGRGYAAVLPRGHHVRYEARQNGKELCASLHVEVGGHMYEATHWTYMRFRWPVRA